MEGGLNQETQVCLATPLKKKTKLKDLALKGDKFLVVLSKIRQPKGPFHLSGLFGASTLSHQSLPQQCQRRKQRRRKP